MRKRNTNAAFLLVCLLSEISEGAAFERRMSMYLWRAFRITPHSPLYYIYTYARYGIRTLTRSVVLVHLASFSIHPFTMFSSMMLTMAQI
jgi:hypothetical protein